MHEGLCVTKVDEFFLQFVCRHRIILLMMAYRPASLRNEHRYRAAAGAEVVLDTSNFAARCLFD